MSGSITARAQRAAAAGGAGIFTGLCGAAAAALLTGGVGWALLAGAATGVAGHRIGAQRWDRAANARAPQVEATIHALKPLAEDGWHLLTARSVGRRNEPRYHLCVPPSANIILLLMDVPWPKGELVHLNGYNQLASGSDIHELTVEALLKASDHVRHTLDKRKLRRRLGAPSVGQVLPVHNAPVMDEHLQFIRYPAPTEKREINVVSARLLVEKMQSANGSVDRRSRQRAGKIAEALNQHYPEPRRT
ncbi:hypothetical protein ACWD0J_33505 [Streptomyces sp. NPDC003011]